LISSKLIHSRIYQFIMFFFCRTLAQLIGQWFIDIYWVENKLAWTSTFFDRTTNSSRYSDVSRCEIQMAPNRQSAESSAETRAKPSQPRSTNHSWWKHATRSICWSNSTTPASSTFTRSTKNKPASSSSSSSWPAGNSTSRSAKRRGSPRARSSTSQPI